jgi:translation elongation factor EF-1alpha
MEKSIVIFGSAHSGKSTLAGYIVSSINKEKDFDFNRYIRKIKEELGDSYVEANKYAYVVDKSLDERIKEKYGYVDSLGTSRHVHFERINLGDIPITIIDTPGAEHKSREKLKGLAFGDFGIFMIELSKLVKYSLSDIDGQETLKNFLAPLFIWKKFKKEGGFITIFSKMDKSYFSEEEYITGVKILENFFGISCDEMNVIPIAIDVEKEIEFNILTKSEKLNWYTGPTLIKKIQEMIKESPSVNGDKPLFMYIDRQFDIIGLGRIIRGKILIGKIEKGKIIKISPVETPDKRYITVSGRIRNMRFEGGKENIELAETGSIVSIDLIDIRDDNGRRISKDDFCITRTSCAVDVDEPIFIGNTFWISIPILDVEKINALETVQLIWFGRIFSSKALLKEITDGEAIVTIQSFGLPCILSVDKDNKFIFDHFIIINDNKEYIQASIKKIGFPDKLIWKIGNKILKEKGDLLKKYFGKYNFTEGDDEIIFRVDNLIELVGKIKDFHETYGLIDFQKSIMIDINEYKIEK